MRNGCYIGRGNRFLVAQNIIVVLAFIVSLSSTKLSLLNKCGVLRGILTLVAQVLAGKYHPDSSIFIVMAKSGCSYAWNRLMCGCIILDKGWRWRIDSGRDVSVYNDRWIPSPTSFMVQSPRYLPPNAKICDIFVSFWGLFSKVRGAFSLL